jgi:hypothetical protein
MYHSLDCLKEGETFVVREEDVTPILPIEPHDIQPDVGNVEVLFLRFGFKRCNCQLCGSAAS